MGLGDANLSGCTAPACRRRRWYRCQCDPPSDGRAARCAGPAAGTVARRAPRRRPLRSAAPPRQACRARSAREASCGPKWAPAVPLLPASSSPSPPKTYLSRQAAGGAAPRCLLPPFPFPRPLWAQPSLRPSTSVCPPRG